MFSRLLALSLLPLVFGAPLLSLRDGTTLPGKYIVVLKPDSPSVSEAMSSLAGGVLGGVEQTQTYDIGNFKGFAASLTNDEVAALRSDPRVAYLELDGIVTTQTVQSQASPPSWGLTRISHRLLGSAPYVYNSTSGEGTCAYIIDTGIYTAHVEFEGRATFVKNFANNVTTDDNGHGTHVAGTIGSRAYGVAKKTKLYGIKVLDSQGTGAWSDIVAGIAYSVTDSKTRTCPNGVVVNMSLGGMKTKSVNDAVAAAVDAGLFIAVAAGNGGTTISGTSPASEPKAFAVGASDINDTFASFSNYGPELAVIAPGVAINSTWNNSPTGSHVISGTSMATPHIAGLAAYLLGMSGPMSPADLRAKIQSLSTTGAINLGFWASANTKNYLAFNGESSLVVN